MHRRHGGNNKHIGLFCPEQNGRHKEIADAGSLKNTRFREDWGTTYMETSVLIMFSYAMGSMIVQGWMGQQRRLLWILL